MTEVRIAAVNSLDALADYDIKKVVIAIGVFDGVHLGHQRLLNSLTEMGKRLDAVPVVLTFHPHPRQILNTDPSVRLITTQKQKIERFKQIGIKAVVTIPFTKSFASLKPNEFIRQCLLAPHLELAGICVGTEWRFGCNGEGTVETLKEFADHGHFEFQAVDEMILNQTVVSSTEIRRAVSAGRLDDAREMLGYPFTISGKVVHGKEIASTQLHYPTANIQSYNGIIPPRGVYAGFTWIDDKKYPSAIAIGVSPTFHFGDDPQQKIEVHILDFVDMIYDQELDVEFVAYIREERCYNSAEQLKKQIAEDIKQVKAVLNC